MVKVKMKVVKGVPKKHLAKRKRNKGDLTAKQKKPYKKIAEVFESAHNKGLLGHPDD